MRNTVIRVLTFVLQAALLLAMAGCTEEPADPTDPTIDYSTLDFTVDMSGIPTGNVSSNASVHDPSVLKVGDTYYIYGSHMAAAKSTDLKSWQRIADGYRSHNPVFGQIYSVYDQAFAWSGAPTSLNPTDDAEKGGGEHVWAPDVIYNKALGKYVMYYCTTSTWNTSNLCYGICDTPDGPFEWQGNLIYSGFTEKTIKHTNVLDVVSEDHAYSTYFRGSGYNYKTCPNAIDPSVFYDQEGRMWMVYGSWSGGIYILELDPNTGLVIHPEEDKANDVDPYFGKLLLGGDHKSIEGPYILYAEGYYYLFVSYGTLTREGGYQIRVFRSDKPNGKYVDMNGGTPYGGGHAAYGLKLSGNYNLPSLVRAYMATGHNSALADSDGKYYVVYHTRFNNNSEAHSPRVHQFLVNKEGWPCMLPFQTQGETVSETGYAKSLVAGRYYMINQGTAIDAEIAEPVILYLLENGAACTADAEGTWTMEEDSYYMTVTLGDKTFSGVFCMMPDEAGNTCMAFSAVGGNESVWGVRYG
ncbi:MAG: glycoside hydrolase family 43 protein [Oscillospiraceae bacterium]|nr:glycoside hydrolase family 43 protein [Oscillospiraceae bacterium]